MVLGNELLGPDPTLEAMYGAVPVTIVHQLARMGIVPSEIRARPALLCQLLQMLAEELGFEVLYSPELPSLDQAKEFLTQRFF